jgi:hypothetical protein
MSRSYTSPPSASMACSGTALPIFYFKLSNFCNETLALKMKQRSLITFYCKLGKNATKAFEDLKMVYGDERLSRRRVFEWFARVRDDRESMEDDPRHRRPVSIRTEENIEKVRNLVNEDR